MARSASQKMPATARLGRLVQWVPTLPPPERRAQTAHVSHVPLALPAMRPTCSRVRRVLLAPRPQKSAPRGVTNAAARPIKMSLEARHARPSLRASMVQAVQPPHAPTSACAMWSTPAPGALRCQRPATATRTIRTRQVKQRVKQCSSAALASWLPANRPPRWTERAGRVLRRRFKRIRRTSLRLAPRPRAALSERMRLGSQHRRAIVDAIPVQLASTLIWEMLLAATLGHGACQDPTLVKWARQPLTSAAAFAQMVPSATWKMPLSAHRGRPASQTRTQLQQDQRVQTVSVALVPETHIASRRTLSNASRGPAAW